MEEEEESLSIVYTYTSTSNTATAASTDDNNKKVPPPDDVTDIIIDPSVEQIENRAFVDSYSLRSVIIPSDSTLPSTSNSTKSSKLKIIGCSAFSGCTSLSQIKLPNGLKEIRQNAFSYCLGLKSVVIPSSVVFIGPGAFSHCFSLLTLTFESIKPISSISRSSSTIPTLIIGQNAFTNCESLISVTLPRHVRIQCVPQFTEYSQLQLQLQRLPQIQHQILPPPSQGVHPHPHEPFRQCKYLVKGLTSIDSSTGTNTNVNISNNVNENMNMNMNMNMNNRCNIITWLQTRYNNLPLHQVCSDPNVTLDQIQSVISSISIISKNNNNTSKNNSTNNNNSINNNNNKSNNKRNKSNKSDKTKISPIETIEIDTKDVLHMTALHVLICNPNANAKMIQLVVNAFPPRAALSIQCLYHNRTSFELYLDRHGLLSYYNVLQYEFEQDRDRDKDQDHRKEQRKRQEQEHEQNKQKHCHISLISMLERKDKVLTWEHMECIMTLQSSSLEQNMIIYDQASSTNTSTTDKLVSASTSTSTSTCSGFYPFMKAAILKQCNLDTLYNLTLNSVEQLYISTNTYNTNVDKGTITNTSTTSRVDTCNIGNTNISVNSTNNTIINTNTNTNTTKKRKRV